MTVCLVGRTYDKKIPTGGHALVTSPSSGMDLALVRELGRRGHPMVMVSDAGPELEMAARALASAFG